MTAATGTTQLSVGTWAVDPVHSSIGFSVRHLMVSKVRGNFENFSGAIVVAEDGTPSVTAQIAVDSIHTNNEQRDAHIKSADFFEVDKYPYITYKLTRVEPIGDEKFRLHGDLTIKDVTKPIVLDATLEGRVPDPMTGGKERLGISVKGQVNRMDFGLNWDGIAGAIPIASHTIKIDIESEIVVKAAELAQAQAQA